MAKLYYRYGAMNSGKTTLMLQTAFNYEERGMKVLLVKPSIDLKGGDYVVSRLGATRKVDILLKKDEDLYEIVKKKKKGISCILVDEAQFLEPIQVDQLMKIVVDFNIAVIAYGIRNDFLTKGFPGSVRLLEIAHTIEEIKTICRCGKKAIYNARFVNGKLSVSGGQVAIDGMDKVTYESVCPGCYYKLLEKSNK